MPFKHLGTNPLPPNPLVNMPLFRILGLFVVGLILAWSTKDFIAWEYWMGAATISTLLCVAFLFISFKNAQRRWGIIAAGLLAIVLLGATRTQMAYEQTKVEWPQHQQTFLGNIKQVTKQYKEGGAMIDVKLKAPHKVWDKRHVRVRLIGKNTPKVGNDIAFSAQINEKWEESVPGDFNYQRYLQLHGISGSAYTPHWKEIETNDIEWRAQLLRWREQLLKQYGTFFEDEDLAILSALTLGDKSRL